MSRHASSVVGGHASIQVGCPHWLFSQPLFCFVLCSLQLSVCLWWHDYRRDDFPTLKFVVVMAGRPARDLLREEPLALPLIYRFRIHTLGGGPMCMCLCLLVARWVCERPGFLVSKKMRPKNRDKEGR